MPTTIRAAALTGYVELARELGLDPLRMLDRAGIPRAALDDLDIRISATALRDLFELCGDRAEDWGLRLQDRRSLSVAGLLVLIAREQPNLRAGLNAIYRHQHLQHDAVAHPLHEAGDVATLQTVLRYESPGPSRQVAEAATLQVLRFCRLFLGPKWLPLGVSFMHAPPISLLTHHRLFGPNVAFNQDVHGIVIRRSELDIKNENADPEIARLVTRFAAGVKQPAEDDPAALARAVVVDLLRTGRCNIAIVAKQLNLDTRTFQRHLAQSNSSYLDILQDVRLDLARHYIEESERDLAEVAELLGFSALSAFSRWHRKSCGRPPSERRDAARPGRQSRASHDSPQMALSEHSSLALTDVRNGVDSGD